MSTDPVTAYALDVISGAVPAGKYHRLACERHCRDLERIGAADFPYVFDLARASRLFRFAENLRHYKGEWAGRPITLESWQRFILGSVIGWVHRDSGLRRFRWAFVQIPRKNGKSLIAAVVLLYLTFFDGEQGAEGYAVATKREQAKIVFGDAKKMVQSCALRSRIRVLVGNLHQDSSSSRLMPLGADHDSTDGLNPNVVVADEIHAMKDRGMLDVMETATGARRQPLIYGITTFGDDPVSVWGDQHDYANKILEGVLVDESFFTFTTHADLEDDWTLPETAAKANPNYGISVNPDDLKAKVTKAQGIPSAAATYKQKHLNLLVNATAPCLSVEGWRKGQSAVPRAAFEEALRGEPCYVGVDLASKIDLLALALVFPPTKVRKRWHVIQRLWTPLDTLQDRAHRDRAPYPVWVEQGWLRTTPGARLDHGVVIETLAELRKHYALTMIGFDPWHADKVIDDLKKEPWVSRPEETVVEVPQTFPGMSSACLRVQGDILAAEVDACGCPVTAWAVSNTAGQTDGKDNLMFSKKRSRGRIDPVIALTMGVALWLRHPPVPTPTYTVQVFGGSRR